MFLINLMPEQALAAFRRTGESDESRKLLAAALASNKQVVPYLLGERRLPKQMPPYISPGGEDQAIRYVSAFRTGWALAQGALDWLRAQAAAPTPAKRRPRRAKPE